MARLDLRGVLAPIPTPFDDRGRILFDRLEENCARWNQSPLRGLVVGGSNGEFALLSVEERVRLVESIRRLIPAERWVIAGSGMEATHETIEVTRRMADVGADAAIVVTPSYYRGRMDGPTLVAHYAAVADDSPIPIVLYNVPANTAVDLPAEAAIELSRHPRIIGIKDSGGDVVKLARMAAESAEGFQVMAGSAGFFLAALAVGAVGSIAALANIAAEAMDALLAAHRRGDRDAAAAIQARLLPANAAVTSRFGVPGLKAAMDLIGMYGGPPRRPLLPLGGSDRDFVREVLARSGILGAG
jgi:4-hydroxy-2-oxoglutarate aldolase